jgi:hypothetical protein
MVTHACVPGLHSKFQDSLGYIVRLCLKILKKEGEKRWREKGRGGEGRGREERRGEERRENGGREGGRKKRKERETALLLT